MFVTAVITRNWLFE